MVRLPDLVGARGLVAVQQVVLLLIDLRALVGESDQGTVEPTHHGVYGAIGGGRPAVLAGPLSALPVDGGGSRARLAQHQSFDQLLQLGELPPPPAVRSRLPRQTRQ